MQQRLHLYEWDQIWQTRKSCTIPEASPYRSGAGALHARAQRHSSGNLSSLQIVSQLKLIQRSMIPLLALVTRASLALLGGSGRGCKRVVRRVERVSGSASMVAEYLQLRISYPCKNKLQQ